VLVITVATGCLQTFCSDHAITGVSTYNVVPDKAAYYFNKVQCFCFEEQRLRGGEVVDMPVFFYLDPELVEDHNCRCGVKGVFTGVCVGVATGC
jgi:cytochrome c oxidase assembly protein Cox11